MKVGKKLAFGIGCLIALFISVSCSDRCPGGYNTTDPSCPGYSPYYGNQNPQYGPNYQNPNYGPQQQPYYGPQYQQQPRQPYYGCAPGQPRCYRPYAVDESEEATN